MLRLHHRVTSVTMSERYEELAGTMCRVVEAGEADSAEPPIMFVHGLGGHADNWSLVMPALSVGRRCLALDLPGFGLSSPAKHHHLDTHVSAVVSLIRGLGTAVTLVGNSMGGLIAERVAAEHPDLVHRLVLIAPATPLPNLDQIADRTVTARLATQSIPVVGELVLRVLQRQLTPRQQTEQTLALVSHRPELLPESIGERSIAIAEMRRRMPWAVRAFSESARSVGLFMVRRDRFAAMARSIRQPTTLIWGTEDRLVSPASMVWLTELRPDWQSIRLEGIGHVPMLEAPDVVIESLQELAPALD